MQKVDLDIYVIDTKEDGKLGRAALDQSSELCGHKSSIKGKKLFLLTDKDEDLEILFLLLIHTFSNNSRI